MKMRFPTYWIGDGTDYGISLFALSVYGSQANPDKE